VHERLKKERDRFEAALKRARVERQNAKDRVRAHKKEKNELRLRLAVAQRVQSPESPLA
jgi:hypothetical protein